MQARSILMNWKQLRRTENNADRSTVAYVEAHTNFDKGCHVSVPIVAENGHAEELGFRDFSSLFLVKENRRQLGNSACAFFGKGQLDIASLCNGRTKGKWGAMLNLNLTSYARSLHRTESKRGPCAASFSSGRTNTPEIHPETPHGGISKKLNALLIPSRRVLGVGWSTADVGLTALLTPKDVSANRHDERMNITR
jgi:hypothetical protein